ncbi:MAG: hypothetical protein K2X47_13025 [Bdellovibrionales bacterium]|nr:hypothetical protein [Bdellovibrionales bacterium]
MMTGFFRRIFLCAVILGNFAGANAVAQSQEASEVSELKTRILALAKSFEGQGDPDFSRQNALEPLVKRLVAISPQPPVKDRLPLLYGTWKQVWGPYDYRNDDRGVDRELGIQEIYQVIFQGGYYYNVSPLYKKGDRSQERIGLLRGQFKLDKKNPNALNVRFTNYPGVRSRPASTPLWELAALAENKTLTNRITIVPTFIVKLFFGGGALLEIYTDKDLRILYGSNNSEFKNPYLYVMTKVAP